MDSVRTICTLQGRNIRTLTDDGEGEGEGEGGLKLKRFSVIRLLGL